MSQSAKLSTKVLSKIIDEFLTANPKDRSWGVNNNKVPFPPLKEYLVKYQNPEAADSIMKIQRELDETKVVLHKTIESVLERGEKIDSLVAKVFFLKFVKYDFG
jgi:synaptobrevin family protein YKT6